MQDVYRVVIQSGIDPTMPLDLIACADKGTYLATTGEDALQGLEPVSIWVTSFVVGGAESFECADDEMMVFHHQCSTGGNRGGQAEFHA